MDFTITFNSGGNHGHQLKDALGGLTIGHLFNLNYVHTPYEYLDFFGIGYNYPTISSEWIEKADYKDIILISGPLWDGISDYERMSNYFNRTLLDIDKKSLLIFDKALRVHPFQAIPWYKEGKLKVNIFSKILREVSNNFMNLHSLNVQNWDKPIEVAVHINRGVDYDKEKYPNHFENSSMPRFMFSMDYYENIMEQIENVYGLGNVKFKIYTEELNSEEISLRFYKKKNTKILIGSNRSERNNNLVHSIFHAFVKSDILVCSNSSFSVMCAYFRNGKKTIYHPHNHLRYLPEPNYIKTNENGDINELLLYS